MALVSAFGATALLLAACGGGNDGQAESNGQQEGQAEQKKQPADTGETKEVEDSEQEEAPDTESAGKSPGEATPPGTTLKFGEQAVLPIKKGDKEHLVGLTVNAIEEGDAKALLDEFGDQAEGIEPYYISYEVENLDGADLSFVSAPNISGTGPDGQSSGAVVSGELGDCESASAPDGFAKAGATFAGCELDGSSGEAIVEVKYDGEEKYYDDPVVWKP